MNVAWHIVKKDFIRLKWILVLWAVVLGAGLMLTTIQAGLDFPLSQPFYIAARAVMSGFAPLIAFGLVMGLVHDDPVAEIDAFWITRPIAGGDLLRAKALAWLLFGLLPVVILLPFWLSYDYGWSQVGGAIRQTSGLHLLLAVLALPFAVIAANGSRFVMNLMLGAGGLLLLFLFSRLGNSAGNPALAPELIQSRAWLVAGLWCATALAVTLIQFLRRRTRLSRALILAAVVVGFAVAKWWPWELVAREPAGVTPPAPDFGAATLALGQEPTACTLTIGEKKLAATIAGEVALQPGKTSARRGVMLKIQTVFLDFTGLLEISFSEAVPSPFGLRDLLPGTRPKAVEPSGYFILNRNDGRSFAVQPVFAGGELDTATLLYSHAMISLRPAGAWRGNPPPSQAAWLKDATLVKVTVDASAPHL